MNYYVVGANGAGKTTLLQAITAQTSIPTVHGTTELMTHLGILGDYNALRRMDQIEVLRNWEKVSGQIVEQYSGKDVLVYPQPHSR